MIKNSKIRCIFKKGLKFIEPIYGNKAEIVSSTLKDIKQHIKDRSLKYSVNEKYLTPWFFNIKEKIGATVNNPKVSFELLRNQNLYFKVCV